MHVIGEAANGSDAVEIARATAPDIVLMDISMPGLSSFEAARQIAHETGARIIFVTMHKSAYCVRSAFRVGADGYVMKSTAGPGLLTAIRAVRRGERHIDAAVASALVEDQSIPGAVEALTWREQLVLKLAGEGQSAKEIAATLSLSINTVQVHKVKLMRKLGVKDVRGLARVAACHGIVTPDATRWLART
jgi:two-component system, NarL family, response regulator NreC